MTTMRMKQVSPTFFQVGKKYPFKIYFQISTSKMLVLINENTVLEDEDIVKMKHYVSNAKKVLIEKKFYEDFITKDIPTKGKISSPLAKKFAIHCLEQDDSLSNKQYLEEIVTSTTNIITTLISKRPTTKESKILVDILNEMKKADNEFLTHSSQLFALATTFLFLQPEATDLVYLYELGTSSIVHSYALNFMQCPSNTNFAKTILKNVTPMHLKSSPTSLKKIVAAHIYGHQLNTFDEVSTYLESFTLMEHAMTFLKVKPSNGLKKTIQDYKLLQIPKTMGVAGKSNHYMPAKILLIADHVLSAMNLTIEKQQDEITDNLIISSLNSLKQRFKSDQNSPQYDLAIIRNIEKQLC